MINNTLCKHCSECKTYEYERFDRKGQPQRFLYCEGNKEQVSLSNWYITKDGYAYSTGKVGERKRLFHTLFKTDEFKVIDHHNGVRNDNRLSNLRMITPLCNAQNKHYLKRTSEYPGVHYNKKTEKWIASTHLGKQGRDGFKRYGSFDTELEAYHAYVTGLRKDGRTVNTQIPAYKKYLDWLSEKSQTNLDIFVSIKEEYDDSSRT